jgi:hypothetical protein
MFCKSIIVDRSTYGDVKNCSVKRNLIDKLFIDKLIFYLMIDAGDLFYHYAKVCLNGHTLSDSLEYSPKNNQFLNGVEKE